jgi:hypothetical protein
VNDCPVRRRVNNSSPGKKRNRLERRVRKMKEELVVEVDDTGKSVGIEVKGGSGRRCMELTRFLEEALGPVACRKMKSEGVVHRAGIRNRVVLKRR